MSLGRRLCNTPLRDHGADEVVWGHIESRVEAPGPRRGRADPGEAQNLVLIPLLDDDVLSPGDGQVNGRGRCGDDEGDPGSLTGEGEAHRTNLVRRVTVGGYTVRPDDCHVDQTPQDGARRRAIGLHH